MKISYNLDISGHAEEVFHWLDDPERARIWMSSVSSYELLSKPSGMVGTTFREIVEEDGRRTEMRGVIMGYMPNQSISFHLEGKFNAVDVEYRFEEVENRTRLTLDSDIRFKSLMRVLSIFIKPKIKKKVFKQLSAEFTVLKDLCERDAGRP